MSAESGGGLWAAQALLPGGWARDVRLRWDAQGRLHAARCCPACPTCTRTPSSARWPV